jgi:DNA mismatch repair protein MutH
MNAEKLIEKINEYLDFFIKEKINLKSYAVKNNIPIYINGNMDKGWKGNTLEHILNIKKNNKKGADYQDLEIKTVPVIMLNNKYKIKETTCLSVLNLEELTKVSFEDSYLFNKIKNTLFVLINIEDIESPIIVGTYYLSLNNNQTLKNEMLEDYTLIVNHIFDNIENGRSLDYNLTGKIGKTIQPRPKTGSSGNYTWAFYLKAHVLTTLLKYETIDNIIKKDMIWEKQNRL